MQTSKYATEDEV